MAKKKNQPEGFVIECVEQGLLHRRVSAVQLEEFAEQQINLWTTEPLQASYRVSATSTTIDFQNLGTGIKNIDVHRLYTLVWQQILNADLDAKQSILSEILAAAKEWKFIIAGFDLWDSLKKIQAVSETAGKPMTLAFSLYLIEGTQPHEIDAAALRFASDIYYQHTLSLSFIEATERNSIKAYRNQIEILRNEFAVLTENFNQSNNQFNDIIDKHDASAKESERKFAALKNLYHSELKLNATATYWKNRSRFSYLIGWGSLGLFIVLLWIAYAFVTGNWANLSLQLDKMMEQSNGTINLTSIVAITVPVLAYGWLLRHVSRLFIQNLTLGDDAKYRQVMTMTFLGLQKDEQAGITETERALILNALFRPTPLNTAAEDGPPAGLLDLIKGR